LEIPALNEWQMDTIRILATQQPTVAVAIANRDDEKYIIENLRHSNDDIDQLKQWELVENANKDGMFSGYIESIRIQTGHDCRIFQLTYMGRMVYNASRFPTQQ
jgi:hypothetical protein